MDIFNSKKLIRSKSGLRIVTTNDEFKSPFVLQEPVWVADKEISHCTHCMVKFGFTVRKHHCRRCGLIFCASCCHVKIELQRMCFIDPVRICTICETQTRTENIFFDKHLKLLTNGAVFKYEDPKLGKSYYKLLHCKFSPDHRYLLFDGVKIAPVDINQVTSLIITEYSSSGIKRYNLKYDVGCEKKSLVLQVACGSEVEKIGLNWFSALEKAFTMLGTTVERENISD